MPTYTFPNGQSLAASALSPDQVNAIIQPIVAQIVGLDPAEDPDLAFSAVRVQWPQGGQPAWGIDQDICFLGAAFDTTDEYASVRDEVYQPKDSISVSREMGRTAVWRINVSIYGPNCAARAGLIISAMSLDWVSEALATSSLYFIPERQQPAYAPELFAGQWWKRCDFNLKFNEKVTESISADSAAGVDVTVLTDGGLSTVIHIQKP